MNFNEYAIKFRSKAESENKNAEYIIKCLSYAQKLNDKGLPIIYTAEHFSQLVGIKTEYLYAMANCQAKYYRKFSIPKNNGSKRQISEPLPTLKNIQQFILQNILYKIPCSPYSKAFIRGRSLKDNAKFHRGQKVILKIDIKNYFGSLHGFEVYHFYQRLGYQEPLCILFTKLCILSNSLPQGAPTSPYLSNLLTIKLDDDIFGFCQQRDSLRYTRYADDITISGEFCAKEIIPSISKIIQDNCLSVNYNKIHVVGKHNQQVVTGVVVNEKLQAPKEYRRMIRLEIYYIKKHGLLNHINKKSPPVTDTKLYCQKLLGKINYCLQLNPKDTIMQEYKDYLIGLIKQ